MRKSLMEEREELQAEITKLRAAIGSKAAAVPASKISESKMSWLQINRTLEKERDALIALQHQIKHDSQLAEIKADAAKRRAALPPPVMTREVAIKELERLTKTDPKAARLFWQKHKKLLTS